MSEMIERVVQTLRDIDLTVGTPNYYQVARAVIKAMREPTEAIIKAHHVVPDDNNFDERAADNWRNLIDAVLKAE